MYDYSKFVGGFLVLVFAMLPGIVMGHATTYRMLDNDKAVVVQFGFVDGTAMRQADVTVFAPSDAERVYQSGLTDLNGRFAFYPAESGEWRVRANDGMGHLQVVTVTVAGDKHAAEVHEHSGEAHDHHGHSHGHHDHGHHDHHHGHDNPVRMLFGLSIIMNVFLGGYIYRLTRK